MSYHFMPYHLSTLRNNFKKSRKSLHDTSPFFIENIILKIQVACHIVSCHVTFLYWKIIQKIQKKSPHATYHLSLLKNNSKNLSSMPHHLMPCHIFYWKIILKIQENHLIPRHISLLKNNSKTLNIYIYYNSLRVINDEFSQHVNMSHQLSPLKNVFFQISSSTIEK
jgi:hypothetical protein